MAMTYPSSSDPSTKVINIFHREHASVGGPVTCASIRFPPHHAIDDDHAVNHGSLQQGYRYLKSQGRIVFSRGAWIESHPLCQSEVRDDCGGMKFRSLAFVEESIDTCSTGSTTFETVHGMIFPSSSESLSYLDSSSSSRRNSVVHRHKLSSKLSVVAYGGRRLSFLSGGGLWSNPRSSPFALIPIIKSRAAKPNEFTPYLEVDDWIHEVRLLDIGRVGSIDNQRKKQSNANHNDAFLLALGMVHNKCEIWGFRASLFLHQRNLKQNAPLEAVMLQSIVCTVRCMTYSLSFFGWECFNPVRPNLIAASGTVFGEILVWDLCDTRKANTKPLSLWDMVDGWLATGITPTRSPRTLVAPTQRLGGHVGSVFSVKFGPKGEIASTSDDRTVRLWTLDTPSSDCNNTDNTRHEWDVLATTYTLKWTGWGHTARVWNVSFARFPTFPQSNASENTLTLITAGEDGAARIWRPLVTENEGGRPGGQPLRGHRCESIWSVDGSEGLIITGGNDGCVKLWDLEFRSSYGEVQTFAVPRELANEISYLKSHENIDVSATSTLKKKRQKAKTKSQAIFGITFFSVGCDGSQSKLLVATRNGSLFSLDLSLELWSTHNKWSDQVISSTTNDFVKVDSYTGECIAVHPSGIRVVVGTTGGCLILSSITSEHEKSTTHSHNSAFQTTAHRPVLSVSWVDSENLLVFCARSTVIWYGFESTRPRFVQVMNMGTNAIPTSFAYDSVNFDLYVGDSRGNLAYFNINTTGSSINGGSIENEPASLMTRAHAREHVTGVAVLSKTGDIATIGNDGFMNQCRKDATGKLKQKYSIPISTVPGLRNIWTMESGSIVVGGFYGNEFVVTDISNGYDCFRISTGGRQRRHELVVDFACKLRPNYKMAVCTGIKDGCNMIDLHTPYQKDVDSREAVSSIPSVGFPLHGETINQLCWVECGASCVYLLSGSNDCSVRLMKFENENLVSVRVLPPHESCVRGVCSSRHPTSEVALLVTCGGKLSMECYLLDSNSSSVSLLCSYRTLEIATVDHRMNVVKSIPLFWSESYGHLICAGDSDGNLHVIEVSEFAQPRRTTIGKIIRGNGRPIICLELISCFDHIMAFVGNTAGEVLVWNLPGTTIASRAANGTSEEVPGSPLHVFIGHDSGTNDLSVVNEAINTTPNKASVIVCSVGDDQVLSIRLLTFTKDSCRDGLIELLHESLFFKKRISSAPLKSMKVVNDDTTSMHRLYTSGYNQQVTLYILDISDPSVIKCVSSSSIGTEGHCIDSIIITNSNGSACELIAAGGEGIELLSVDLSIVLAAKTLHEANYLLITAGAGFSADSGLDTYECRQEEYREFCNPDKLISEPHRFQKMWMRYAVDYLKTVPHNGYELIDQWCNGGFLPNLKRVRSDNDMPVQDPWWVYTSNVDGHFRRFKSFYESTCEIHGVASEYICSCRIGYINGEPRFGIHWDQWNQQVPRDQTCSRPLYVTKESFESYLDANILCVCNQCHLPLRPNVLMFHDTDENVLRSISIQRERYQDWESKVEGAICLENGNLVILELGCGVNVPAVRQESEEVLLDCTKKIRLQKDGFNGSVCLIRINPKNSEVVFDGSISIHSNAKIALEHINHWLKKMNE